jgi:hypothetical protein
MDIGSANSVLTLAIATLLPSPVQLQGFGIDDIYDIAQVKNIETLMGVDGVLSAGFVWKERVQTVTLQADSVSNDIFDMWNANQEANLQSYPAQGVIRLPGIATKFVQTRGFLTGYKPAPKAGRLLHARTYEITWQRVAPAPV